MKSMSGLRVITEILLYVQFSASLQEKLDKLEGTITSMQAKLQNTEEKLSSSKVMESVLRRNRLVDNRINRIVSH